MNENRKYRTYAKDMLGRNCHFKYFDCGMSAIADAGYRSDVFNTTYYVDEYIAKEYYCINAIDAQGNVW